MTAGFVQSGVILLGRFVVSLPLIHGLRTKANERSTWNPDVAAVRLSTPSPSAKFPSICFNSGDRSLPQLYLFRSGFCARLPFRALCRPVRSRKSRGFYVMMKAPSVVQLAGDRQATARHPWSRVIFGAPICAHYRISSRFMIGCR